MGEAGKVRRKRGGRKPSKHLIPWFCEGNFFFELMKERKKVALRLIHPQESKIRNGLLSGRICSIRIL